MSFTFVKDKGGASCAHCLSIGGILTLDLETTGLTADAEIIQLSIMNGCGDVPKTLTYVNIET